MEIQPRSANRAEGEVDHPKQTQGGRRQKTDHDKHCKKGSGAAEPMEKYVTGVEPAERWVLPIFTPFHASLLSVAFDRTHEMLNRSNPIFARKRNDLRP